MFGKYIDRLERLESRLDVQGKLIGNLLRIIETEELGKARALIERYFKAIKSPKYSKLTAVINHEGNIRIITSLKESYMYEGVGHYAFPRSYGYRQLTVDELQQQLETEFYEQSQSKVKKGK